MEIRQKFTVNELYMIAASMSIDELKTMTGCEISEWHVEHLGISVTDSLSSALQAGDSVALVVELDIKPLADIEEGE